MSNSSDTSIDVLPLSDIAAACEKQGGGRYFIEIPKFQRSVVWSDEQREKLVESLFVGFPIGSLMCHNTGRKQGNRDVIQLVDGLQRTTTILQFMAQPLTLSPLTFLVDEGQIEVMCRDLHGTVTPDLLIGLKRTIHHWLRETKTLHAAAGFAPNKLAKALVESFDLTLSADDFNLLCDRLAVPFDMIASRVGEVMKSKIPIIVYSGDSENIPTIFERLNSQGTSLTKYEIFAATWIESNAIIQNPAVREAVEGKYRELTERGYVVAGFDESAHIPADKFNLFEYLFGLGKVLCDKFEFIFPESGKADESSPLGFVFATIAYGLKLSDMGKLATRIAAGSPPGPMDLHQFEVALFRSCEVIQKKLKPYLKLNLNRQGATSRFLPHSQNQIVSLVLSHLLWAHNPITWEHSETPEARLLESNVARNYLFDMVRESWKGSGDSRLWDMCWGSNFDYVHGNRERSTMYCNAPNDEQWLAALTNWHDDQLSKKQKERPNVPEKSKAVLKFLYAHIVSVQHDEDTEFDIEHLYPVAVLSEAISSSGEIEGWPISAFGNLALLPRGINRIKGSHMLGDFLFSDSVDPKPTAGEIERLQDFIISPDIAEISSNGVISREIYHEFVSRRFDVLARRLLEHI
jgi:hypothetical protein